MIDLNVLMLTAVAELAVYVVWTAADFCEWWLNR